MRYVLIKFIKQGKIGFTIHPSCSEIRKYFYRFPQKNVLL